MFDGMPKEPMGIPATTVGKYHISTVLFMSFSFFDVFLIMSAVVSFNPDTGSHTS